MLSGNVIKLFVNNIPIRFLRIWILEATLEQTDFSIGRINIPTSKPISLEENISCSSKPLAQKRPCQDYYTFENDRKPEHFKVGQIWGAKYRANLPHNFRYAPVACNSA